MHSLSREQAIDAARQLHWEVCLMTSNLNILDQYVLCLQGTVAKILEISLGTQAFPSAAVAAEARVRRASVHMEAMGLWRPSLDPVGWACYGPVRNLACSIDCFVVWTFIERSGVIFVVMICCIYVAGLAETGHSGCGAGHG